MKNLLSIVFIFISVLVYSQERLKFNIGFNISNVKQIVVNNDIKSNTTFNYRKSIILPSIKIVKQIALSDKFEISTGLGVGWYGAKDYNINIPNGYNIDKNLRIGYIQLPIYINIETFNNIYLNVGYTYSHKFRKNVDFAAFDDKGKIYNISKKVNNFILFGLCKKFGNYSIELIYEHQINTVFNSRGVLKDIYGYAKIMNYNISISRIINNERP